MRCIVSLLSMILVILHCSAVFFFQTCPPAAAQAAANKVPDTNIYKTKIISYIYVGPAAFLLYIYVICSLILTYLYEYDTHIHSAAQQRVVFFIHTNSGGGVTFIALCLLLLEWSTEFLLFF